MRPLLRKLRVAFIPKDVSEFFFDVTKQAIEIRNKDDDQVGILFFHPSFSALSSSASPSSIKFCFPAKDNGYNYLIWE